jgi:alpha-1,6-mannosyltransferase
MKPRFWLALAAQLALFGALNFFDDWTLETMPLKFVACAILCGLAYLLAAGEFTGAGKGALIVFWSVTIALRFLALPLEPSSEVWRYQADGAIQRIGFDPYQLAPDHPHLSGAVPELGRVPRSNEPTAFAAGAELLFRLIPASGSGLLFKIVFGLADLVAVGLLLRCTDIRTAAWYAWNPLIAYSFAGAAHFDSVVLLALVALIVCLTRFEEVKTNRWLFAFGAALSLGSAIAIRPVMVVALLPCAFALRRYFIMLAAAIAMPLVAMSVFRFPTGANLFGDFNHVSRLNDLFWWLIEETVLPNWHQRYFRYDVVILAAAAIVSIAFARNWRRGLLRSLAVAIILAPVLHAWYVTWILPVATWRRAYAWHFLAVTIFAYYLFFNERLFALPWHAGPLMRGMIALPVLFIAVMLALQKAVRENAPTPSP